MDNDETDYEKCRQVREELMKKAGVDTKNNFDLPVPKPKLVQLPEIIQRAGKVKKHAITDNSLPSCLSCNEVCTKCHSDHFRGKSKPAQQIRSDIFNQKITTLQVHSYHFVIHF